MWLMPYDFLTSLPGPLHVPYGGASLRIRWLTHTGRTSFALRAKYRCFAEREEWKNLGVLRAFARAYLRGRANNPITLAEAWITNDANRQAKAF